MSDTRKHYGKFLLQFVNGSYAVVNPPLSHEDFGKPIAYERHLIESRSEAEALAAKIRALLDSCK